MLNIFRKREHVTNIIHIEKQVNIHIFRGHFNYILFSAEFVSDLAKPEKLSVLKLYWKILDGQILMANAKS